MTSPDSPIGQAEEVGLAPIDPLDGNPFSSFAQRAHLLFAGLIHISILCLPARPLPGTHASSTTAAPASKRKPGRDGGSSRRKVPLDLSWDKDDDALDLLLTGGLDWSNCAVWTLSPDQGHSRQPTPPYTVGSTALAAAAKLEAVVLTNDYATSGPRYADWDALHCGLGAASMAAAPLHAELAEHAEHAAPCLGVLGLASCDRHAFADRGLLAALSSLLLPLIARLAALSRGRDVETFLEHAMPLLLEQRVRLRVNGSRTPDGGQPPEGPREGSVAGPAPGANGRRSGARGEALHKKKRRQAPTAPGPRPVGAPPAETRGAAGAEAVGTPCAPGRHVEHDACCPHHASNKAPLDGTPPGGASSGLLLNLVSMCAVYAHFSHLSAAGETNAAVLVSACVVASHVALLILQWIWLGWLPPQRTSAGAKAYATLRALALPLANTWVGWSLLDRLGYVPSLPAVLSTAGAVGLCLAAGRQARSLLQGPLQLASMALAATSTTGLCSAAFGSTRGWACMGLISGLQLGMGVLLPALMLHAPRSDATAFP
ncbi:hypothetical protein ACKKBG_A17525 [Auxenochlorella protothecoides x Auxenochlorella symbiontica]